MTSQITRTSTPNKSGALNVPPLAYVSPTLHALGQHLDPSSACETCPASIWFRTEQQLKAYCSRMHHIVWDGVGPPILQCDGRELALMALMAGQDQ